MIKLPFGRKTTDKDGNSTCAAFSEYCADELERRRDSDAELDVERFQAAVDLAVGKLCEMDDEAEV